MFKDVIQSLDSGILPIIGLIAFLIAFILIIVWVFTMSKETRNKAKQMPLDDTEDQSFKK